MNANVDHESWMRRAIETARRSIARGQSPFAAVIVRSREVIADTHNHVRLNTDPTAHAEIMCIREAARNLRTIDLSGCVMYTTTEPCPMCAAAIHWARLDAVYFGARIADAERAGFNELAMPIEQLYAKGSQVRAVPGVLGRECAALFDEWKKAGGVAY